MAFASSPSQGGTQTRTTVSTSPQCLTWWKLTAKLEGAGCSHKEQHQEKSSRAIHCALMLVKIQLLDYMTAHLSLEPLQTRDAHRTSRMSSWSEQILKAKIWASLNPLAKFILTSVEPRFSCHLIAKTLGFQHYCIFPRKFYAFLVQSSDKGIYDE